MIKYKTLFILKLTQFTSTYEMDFVNVLGERQIWA
jgi:hypothetical protein